jgi:hypothetical protein
MAFPFMNKSFEGWVSDELKNREFSKNEINTYTPFIWLSSGAHVCTGKKPASFDQTAFSAIYKGCVISNHIDQGIKYPTEKSYLGYDLNGKLIEVNSSKKTSTPIIESMDIDTDGENNTLKTAKLSIIVFSLKQLEMFELFFLRPSMTVVLEYGYNNPQIKNEVAAESFINGKNWRSYTNEVADYFTPDSGKYISQRTNYLEKLKKTKGCYDFWIGKVSNFNVSYEGSDSVYRVDLDISSGNELHLWMPIKQQATTAKKPNANSTTNQPEQKPGAKQWMKQLCGELILSEATTKELVDKVEKEFANEFFNWGVTSETTNKENVSKDSYISFKLILDILNSTELVSAYKKKIDYGHVTIDKKIAIPVMSHPRMISTNADFVIPGNELPLLVVNPKEGTVDIDPKTNLKFPINGKVFNYPTATTNDIVSAYSNENYKIPAGATIGNLLNIFVNKNLFVRLFKDSYTFTDFYNSILNMINDLLFGVCKLEITNVDDTITSNPITIVDVKLCTEPTTKIKSLYRFNSDPLRGIMHDMKFSVELSNLQQAQALYESQLSIRDAKNNARQDPKDKNKKTDGAAFKTDKNMLKLVGQTNSDNMYSIDWVMHEINKRMAGWQEKEKTDTDTQSASTNNDEANVVTKLESVIKGKSIKFEVKEKTPATVIYQDYTLIQAYIVSEIPGTSVLTYLECELTIDGMAGFRCGEMFNIDGVPEMYNRNGAFQILNVKQSVQPDTGWRTTIHAGFRYDVK